MDTFCIRKCCIVAGIFMLCPALSLLAQDKTYSLPSLVDAAKNYLPSLMQKRALVNSAEAMLADTRHSFLPQIKASEQVNIGTANSMTGSYLPIGYMPSTSAAVRGDNTGQVATGNIAALYSEYELFNFGLNKARINYAQAYIGLNESDFQRELYLVQVQVARLYFSLLKSSYRLQTDKQNVNRYDSIFMVIRALTSSGIRPGSDSSLAKAELSKARITYNQTLGSVNQLKEQLGYLTGVGAASLAIDTTAGNFNTNRLLLSRLQVDTSSNPLIDYYSKIRNIYQSNEKVISRSYLPKVILAGSTWARGSSIQYNDNYKSLNTGLGYQRFNYAAGLGLTYNLFNGMYKKDKLAINRFQLKASEYQLQQQKLVLNSSFMQAKTALETTEFNLLELPIQLKAAEDTYQQKSAQYKAGIITLIDLTNASFVLYRSQTDYIETISDWYLAKLDQSVAAGNLPQFIQTIK